MEHQNGNWKSVHNAFQMGMVRLAASCHQMLIYNVLMWHFLHLQIVSGNYLRFLGVTFRHVLAETTKGRCSLKDVDPTF